MVGFENPGSVAMPWTRHPEGGSYREVFRSVARVQRFDGASRSALTHIEFRLDPPEVSQFHRVEADEVWNLYCGVLRLWLWDGSDHAPQVIELSETAERYCAVIPAGWWQAAEPVGGAVHVGCTVGPGFEFEDFALLPAHPETRARLLAITPDLVRLCGRDES